jgi:tetratricopeptide (TPR) repeat protein
MATGKRRIRVVAGWPAIGAALAWLAVAAPSAAAADGDRQTAARKTEQATAAYNIGRYEEAARLYEEAYLAVPDPDLLFNIGQAYRMAGRPEQALTSYKSYLRVAPPNPKVRPQVEARVAELEKIVADTKGSQAAPPPSLLPGSGGAPVAAGPAAGVQAAAGGGRAGWTFGVGLGLGSLQAECDTCRDSFEAGGLHGHAGWLWRPSLSFEVDVWGMVHSEGALTVHQTLAVVAARYWVLPRLWLKGGVGVASAGYRWSAALLNFEDRTENKPGLMLAAGYELFERRGMAVDAQLRYGTGLYEKNVGDAYVVKAHSLMLGAALNWY